MDILKKALQRAKGASQLLLHSDQGWQYQMPKYRQWLKENGINQSMSKKGNCLDNAIIKNIFGTLKSKLFYLKQYESAEKLRSIIEDYICYHNN